MSFPAWHVLTAAQNAADEALLTVGFGDGGGGGTTVGLLREEQLVVHVASAVQ